MFGVRFSSTILARFGIPGGTLTTRGPWDAALDLISSVLPSFRQSFAHGQEAQMAPSRHGTALTTTLALGLLVFLLFDVPALGTGRSSGYTPPSTYSASSHGSALSSVRSGIKCESCPRDNRGKIKRDPNAKSEFKRTNPKPPGCDRCEVDHVVPLSKGGRDDPSNMEWLPREQHQDKTRRDLGR